MRSDEVVDGSSASRYAGEGCANAADDSGHRESSCLMNESSGDGGVALASSVAQACRDTGRRLLPAMPGEWASAWVRMLGEDTGLADGDAAWAE